MRRTDSLIVGGGPAGAAAAITLAAAGRDTLLIERKARAGGIVCGGFLSWDTLAALDRLGVSAGALGAHPIGRVRIHAGTGAIEARLPGKAAGLSRATLDEALLRRAAEAGAEVWRGVAVTRLEDRTATLGDGERVAADAVMIATGKHALRGSPRAGAHAGSVGLRTTMRATADLAGVIELHLFDGGYAGLLMQEDGRANLCLSVAPARLRAAGGGAEALLAAIATEAPALGRRIADGGGWSSVAAVPYGWRARSTAPGIYRIGDQAAVIASVVGDGMGIALASGISAAAALIRDEASTRWQAGFARRARRPVAIAELARHLAERPARAAAFLPMIGWMPGAIGLAARLTRIGH